MHTSLGTRRVVQWLVMAFFLGFGMAMAQTEPTMSQIYATAQSGKLADAQVMIQQVLVLHPKSAKAFFVQAELYSRQGQLDRARESLGMAEKLSPGLAFAKPEAVQALRAQLAPRSNLTMANGSTAHSATPMAPAAPANSGGSWALPLLLAGGVVVAGYFLFRKRTPEPMAQHPVYANQNGLNGPQTFGMGAGGGGVMSPGGYPQQPGYPQQAGSGLGGRIMGGVATGLAVGAGVMAAEAIGRNLMGNHNTAGSSDHLSNNDYRPIDSNPDMGGANFGINDAGSWDDGGSMDSGGGSDWDN